MFTSIRGEVKRTGIFFHYQDGERLRDFPHALDSLLERPNVFLYDAFYPSKPKASYELEPVSQDLLPEIHSPEMIQRVRMTPYYDTAIYSAGGTVQAAEEIWQGGIDNAFVFTGTGDHHAGRNFFGGWCYLNGAALAIANQRRKYGARKFAIIDTDSHHGDGTWDIFAEDEEVLYFCFCPESRVEQKNKINITVSWRTSDEEYLRLVEREFVPRGRSFAPELIFWNWGYDGTQGEYGDIGLTVDCHPRLAEIIQAVADEVCGGRLVTVLCGGHSGEIASYTIPRVLRCLAGVE